MLVPLTALAVCVVALAAFEPQVRRLSENSWWEIVLSPDLPNSLRMIMALAVLLAVLAILAAAAARPCQLAALARRGAAALCHAWASTRRPRPMGW